MLKIYHGIYGFFVERSFNPGLLIGKNKFCVVKIYFNGKSFLFIDKIANPVIVLRNADRFMEQAIVPSAVIMPFDALKSEIIP